MAHTVTEDTGEAGRAGNDRKVWLAAIATCVLGGISALLAFWPSVHLLESVLGGLSLPLGAWAQMYSTETNQRWAAICGAVAGGFGFVLGLAHGGFTA